MKKIPVYRGRGSNKTVTAYAKVDDDQYEELVQSHWYLAAGYPARTNDGKTEYMHRFLLDLAPGDGIEVDHINRNKFDNQHKNLRVATRAQNAQNYSSRKGKFRNVYPKRDPYRKKIWAAAVNRHVYRLGHYSTPEEAAQIASEWRAKNMPFSEDNLQ